MGGLWVWVRETLFIKRPNFQTSGYIAGLWLLTNSELNSYFHIENELFQTVMFVKFEFRDQYRQLFYALILNVFLQYPTLVVRLIVVIMEFIFEKYSCDIKNPNEAQRVTYRAPEYNVPPFWRIGQGSQFCLLIGQNNTNMVEDVEIMLPVKFHWILFSSFRGEVKNI